jgi:hypothetical protein
VTTAVYNQDGQWEIPAYVWPAVLGTSLAVHISFLIFGLPVMSGAEHEPVAPPEIELVIESGGLEFESLSAVETIPTETTVSEVVQAASPIEAPLPQKSVDNTVLANQVAGEKLQTVNANTELEKTVSPVVADNVPLSEAVVVTEPSVTVLETNPTASLKSSSSPVNAVSTVSPTADQNVTPVTVAPSVPSSTIVVGRPASPTSSTTVSAVPIVGSPVQVQVTEVPSVSATENKSDPISRIEATVPQESTVTSSQVATVTASRPQSTQIVKAVPNAVAVETAAPIITSVDVTEILAPPPVVPVIPPQEEVIAVASSNETEEVTEVPNGTVQAVSPIEQQIASVPSAEVDFTAIAPTETEASQIPSTETASDPTDNVAPFEVASIDPLAKAESYVASYDVGDCAHLTVMSAGADSATVTAYGAGIAPFSLFDQRFAADHGYEANIELRLVSRRQCALLDALGLSEGIETAGLVDLDQTVVRSGTSVSGIIQRDLPLGRIAAANEAGLELNGKGPPEVYLIDGAGQIHDGRRYLLPATNAVTAGGWKFAVPVTLKSSDAQETALVLAIWNRPKSSQPKRFGTLPADRIAGLLAEPGVFSLSAFKVSR